MRRRIKIVATATYVNPQGWTCSIQIPTFYLEDVASMGEACRIAYDVIDPHKLMKCVAFGAYCEETQEYQGYASDRAA